ncbi:GNAT family N-acetyltransferase [Paracoccus sediminis]|uniref:GNAT family N-acetyltransferase n=1 Tax=Paracoccus sediminis TaxID=1214787 RepID=A0A238URN0_9RHOB|nr:GNAT family N-acetyltransferase [Paracoccus sediminis]TBN52886.1 GNAT family N-acetyltransferase [Paracoccus sediminis]SNR24800.1 putative acetyltransferase [Paracoccus sediminis]
MTCACGHHHAPRHHHDAGGTPIALPAPMVGLTGRLICQDADQMMTALALLPEHSRLSREEPGCLRFDLWQDEDPLIWNLSELFIDADAFAAHAARTKDSEWGRQSTGIGRDFQRHDVIPVIRHETRNDLDAIDALMRDAFGGNDEARIVRKLRQDGDLALSLVADAAGALAGHVALSPLGADGPAFALAPLSVAPKAQRLGIGAALVHGAVTWADAAAVVVLGAPSYYGPLGFKHADLSSPYAGLALQMIGDLPKGSPIRHAPGFVTL